MDFIEQDVQGPRERIIQVFRYLQALNEHRHPAKRLIGEQPWHLWFKDLPTHPAIRIQTEDDRISDDTVILQVVRPALTACPHQHGDRHLW